MQAKTIIAPTSMETLEFMSKRIQLKAMITRNPTTMSPSPARQKASERAMIMQLSRQIAAITSGRLEFDWMGPT